MAFDPSVDFHEYRFDWHADKVDYFVDGVHAATLIKQVPDMATKIMLNHWSGNIEGWGGPAPTQDMFMEVDWMEFTSDYPAVVTLAKPQGRQTAFPTWRPNEKGLPLCVLGRKVEKVGMR